MPAPKSTALAAGQDASLVQAALRGQRSAWSQLYQRYAAAVHACVLAKVPAADAEDLVQDVFLVALEKLSSLADGEKFGGWLMSIARNRRTDYWRRHRKKEQLSEAMQAKRDTSPDAERALAAIRELPDAYQEPLLMRLVEGMTGPEIAASLDMTHGSVRVNLTKGMKLLREQLALPSKTKRKQS